MPGPPPRASTDEQRAYVRQACPTTSLRQMARRLGTARRTLARLLRQLGLQARYRPPAPWPERDISLLRELYPTHSNLEIARRLGKSASAVAGAANKLGLRRRRDPAPSSQELCAFLDLHSRGFSQPDIARGLGVTVHHVANWRRGLGLPTNYHNHRHRAKQAAAHRERCQRDPSSGPYYCRLRARRAFAARHGWPEDLRPREVQILNTLAEVGVPVDRYRLGARIGKDLTGPGRHYLSRLVERRLLVSLPRCAPQRCGGGLTVTLYTLGPAALSILEERARCEATKDAK